jgi:hypothetical protein
MKRTAASLLCLALASGCMHKVKHELPPNAYFGHVPAHAAEQVSSFAADGMKNWWLAGLVPYTSWNSANLIPQDKGVARVENLMVQTQFSTIDTIVWVIPGFAYGYYVWAPRTVTVSGSKVVERNGKR